MQIICSTFQPISPIAICQISINKCRFFFDISGTYKCITYTIKMVILQSLCLFFVAPNSMKKLGRNRLLFILFIVIQNPVKGSYNNFQKKKKKKIYIEVLVFINTWIRTHTVTHTSTNQAQCCLTSVMRWVLIPLHQIGRFPNLSHDFLWHLISA